MQFDIVIPITIKDMPTLQKNYLYICNNINFKRMYIIGNNKIKSIYNKFFNDNIIFLDEDKINPNFNFFIIKKLLVDVCGNDRRTGWYFQQFLKMAFAYICDNEYYLVWDADTIPLRKIEFNDGDKIFYNLKDEYNKPYFSCIEKLLGIKKINCIKKSFISEHMMFSKKIMLELINKIEKNSNIKGKYFFEKIMYSIDKKYANASGFSEFETYGCFTYTYYRDTMKFRNLITLRNAKYLFGDNILDSTLKWLSKDFDTISIEKFDNISIKSKKYNSLNYQKNHSSLQLVKKYKLYFSIKFFLIKIIRKLIR